MQHTQKITINRDYSAVFNKSTNQQEEKIPKQIIEKINIGEERDDALQQLT